MPQLAIPTEVAPHEVARKTSLGGAIELCAEVAGLAPKEVQQALRVDKAQWSRWLSGGEGVIWKRVSDLMDVCGNEAPLLWMCHDRRYDLGSMRKLETETERQNRLLREEVAVLRRALQGSAV